MGDFSITNAYDNTKSKAVDLYNKFKFNTQQTDAAASNWTPAMQNQLMGALNGQGITSDAASGRMTDQ
ncbi:hypothetical protein J6A64_03235 [bacterium]|nr:hypothetical protein [bacterium]MBO5447471.1 hypothetical protein [bacterium]